MAVLPARPNPGDWHLGVRTVLAGARDARRAHDQQEEERHMAVRVAINGFGRIGRNVLRAIAESGRKDIEVVGINDLGPVETNAHLLRFDSVHGRFPGEVTVEGDTISRQRQDQGHRRARSGEAAVEGLGVDIALECTGIFTAKDKASRI
jgi:glyceraldehyde 3-phosphate dehydrogenase